MTQMVQFIAVLLAAFGMVSVGWLVLGALVLPGGCAGRIVIDARGDGEGLEQAVKAALWLERSGLWRGAVVIEDAGRARLARRWPELWQRRPASRSLGMRRTESDPTDVSRETSVL